MTAEKTKTKGSGKVYIGVKVPAEHAFQLRKIATRLDLSVSQLFRPMLREQIASVKHENG